MSARQKTILLYQRTIYAPGKYSMIDEEDQTVVEPVHQKY